MKNLSLFVTLGIISLMGAFAPVNAGEVDNMDNNLSNDSINPEAVSPTSDTSADELPVVTGEEKEPVVSEDKTIEYDQYGNPVLPSEEATDSMDTAPAAE